MALQAPLQTADILGHTFPEGVTFAVALQCSLVIADLVIQVTRLEEGFQGADMKELSVK